MVLSIVGANGAIDQYRRLAWVLRRHSRTRQQSPAKGNEQQHAGIGSDSMGSDARLPLAHRHQIGQKPLRSLKFMHILIIFRQPLWRYHQTSRRNGSMCKLWPYLLALAVLWAQCSVAAAQLTPLPVGRFQLVSVPAGQQAGVFLLDTATGCTWQLGANPDTKRLTFIEMDVENLHWSWGSGAQQKLAQKIEESKLPEEQKTLLKQELSKTACGWTPVVLTPPATDSGSRLEATPSRRR
jgi:hypothetical protein